MRTVLIDTLIEMAEKDDRIWLLYADVGYGHVERFQKRFPERTVNCGIREQATVGIAAGLALEGKLPFVYAMATFLTRRAYEQIAVDVANPNLPVTLLGIGGGKTYADAGYAHCPDEDLSIMGLLPNMEVRWPYNPSQLVRDLRNAPRPLYLRVGDYEE